MHTNATLQNLVRSLGGKGHFGHVNRVVPGLLFYVEVSTVEGRLETLAVKLNNVLVLRGDHITAYRGESFSELGISEGTVVLVVERPDGPETVVVEAPGSFGYLRELSSGFFRKRVPSVLE
jgi:hypothetical protein